MESEMKSKTKKYLSINLFWILLITKKLYYVFKPFN